VADPADDPEVVLQKKTRAELLRHSLARLSPEHGEVIDLVYFHGKSVKEVAEIVGIATATVKTRMFYARKKLADFVSAALCGTLSRPPGQISINRNYGKGGGRTPAPCDINSRTHCGCPFRVNELGQISISILGLF
jgi:predicted DNA-binding protein (UPF0251 family)